MASAEHEQLLRRLGTTARDLLALTANVSSAHLQHRPPAAGGTGADARPWSAAMVIAHLSDTEQVCGVRMRLVITEARPLLTAFDPDMWVERFGALDTDHREALGRWRALREANLALLRSITADEWHRTGVHAERGELRVADLVQSLADHDAIHLDQIRAALAKAAAAG